MYHADEPVVEPSVSAAGFCDTEKRIGVACPKA